MKKKIAGENGAFHIDGQAFYDAIVSSTEDYIYIIDMTTDMALISDNMLQDFELREGSYPALFPCGENWYITRIKSVISTLWMICSEG